MLTPGLPVITRFFKGKEGRLIQAQGGVAEGGAGRYLDAGFEGGGRGSEPRNSSFLEHPGDLKPG